jgi:hypothetical protein
MTVCKLWLVPDLEVDVGDDLVGDISDPREQRLAG